MHYKVVLYSPGIREAKVLEVSKECLRILKKAGVSFSNIETVLRRVQSELESLKPVNNGNDNVKDLNEPEIVLAKLEISS